MNKIPTVPVQKAIQLTSNWRSFYAEIYNDSEENLKKIDPDGKDVFRGFRVPLEDLEQILKTAKSFNTDHSEKINSIRVYLVKDTEDATRLGDIHIILVPVIGGKEIDPLPPGGVAPHGKDLLQMENKTLGITESVIYDFSLPCPTECDPESELYSSKS